MPAGATAQVVLISDATGRELRRQTLAPQQLMAELDLAGLAPGVYIVRCGARATRLLVE